MPIFSHKTQSYFACFPSSARNVPRGPNNNGVGYPPWQSRVEILDLIRYVSGFRNAYINRFPSNLKLKARIS